jgi:hypothetical protein
MTVMHFSQIRRRAAHHCINRRKRAQYKGHPHTQTHGLGYICAYD